MKFTGWDVWESFEPASTLRNLSFEAMEFFQSPSSEDRPFRRFAHGRLSAYLLDAGEPLGPTADYLAELVDNQIASTVTGLDRFHELLASSDICLSANSFEEERRAHKQIGDSVLFWTGVFPERAEKQLPTMILSPVKLGKSSYLAVSSFDYGPYAAQAPLFRLLSERFELYLCALRAFREGWGDLGPAIN